MPIGGRATEQPCCGCLRVGVSWWIGNGGDTSATARTAACALVTVAEVADLVPASYDYNGRQLLMSNGIPSMTHTSPDYLDGQDPNVARLIELGVLPDGYNQLEGKQPLALVMRQLADWVDENFDRKPDPMQQAIDRAALRS